MYNKKHFSLHSFLFGQLVDCVIPGLQHFMQNVDWCDTNLTKLNASVSLSNRTDILSNKNKSSSISLSVAVFDCQFLNYIQHTSKRGEIFCVYKSFTKRSPI